jgi:hypothetical protein
MRWKHKVSKENCEEAGVRGLAAEQVFQAS